MGFNPNDKDDGHIHGILCYNLAILETHVCLAIANKRVNIIFQFCYEKKFFHCMSARKEVFVKQLIWAKWSNCNFHTKWNTQDG